MTQPATIQWILFDWGKAVVDYRPLGLAKLAQRLEVELATLRAYVSETHSCSSS